MSLGGEAKGGGSGSRSGSSGSSGKTVHVSGYTRRDGTYVSSYDRAPPGQGQGARPVSGAAPTADGSTAQPQMNTPERADVSKCSDGKGGILLTNKPCSFGTVHTGERVRRVGAGEEK
jgi:hypothetical protein